MLIKNSRTLLLNSKFSINFGRNFSQHTKTVLYTTRMSSSSSKTNNLKVSPGSSEILNDSSESSTSTSPASPSSTTSTSSSSSPSFFFKQFINLSAIQSLSLAVENPSILIPNHHYSSVLDIDLKNLKSNGVKYLVFDKDNTLCYCYSSTFAPGVDAFINEAKQIFGEKSIAILSNSSGSNDDKDYKSAKKIEDSLNLSVIKHKKKKPGCLDDVLKHFQDNFNITVSSKEICVIGDRITTDIMFGNMHGMKSILVEPWSYIYDHPVGLFFRFIENKFVLPIIKYSYSGSSDSKSD